MSLTTIPLSKLVISPLNVRQTVRIDPQSLRRRATDGSYPFVQHRTCAEWTTSEAAGR